VDEARLVAQKFGPAFRKVIAKVDELSGVDKEAIEKTNATFQAGGSEQANGREAEVVAAPAGGR
jgi:hypothetical protein